MGNYTKHETDKLSYYLCPGNKIYVCTKRQTFIIKNPKQYQISNIDYDLMCSLILCQSISNLESLARYCKRLELKWEHTEVKPEILYEAQYA